MSALRNSLILCVASASLSSAVGGMPKRAVTPEDIAAIRWFTSPDLAPDGKTVAYLVVEWDSADAQAERKRTIWLAPTDGSKPLRPFAADHQRVVRPLWSPDGTSLAFLSSGKDKDAKQIYVAAVDGSRLVRLTNDVAGIRSFQWSPDGKAIAFRAIGKSDRPETAPIEVGRDYANARLWVLDVPTSKDQNPKPRAVTNGEKHVLDFAWSPDSARFAVTLSPTPLLDDVFLHASLVVMDREGKIERPFGNLARPTLPNSCGTLWQPCQSCSGPLGNLGFGVLLVSANYIDWS